MMIMLASMWRGDAGLCLEQALLRRLGDEDFEVSSVALGLSSIGRIPPAALFDALTALIRNSTAIVTCRPGTQGVDKSDRKQARGLVRKVRTQSAATAMVTQQCP